MITSNLTGGLGNQIFQIASAYAHSMKNNDTACFNFNKSHTPLQGNNVIKYKNTLFKEFCHDDDILNKCVNVYNEKKHSYDSIEYQENQKLCGYFQSEKYFYSCKETIINKLLIGLKSHPKWLSVTEELNKLKLKTNKPIVSLHVRRGDYLNFPDIHPHCTIDYYNKAIKLLLEQIGEFYLYVISDDIIWCKNNFGNNAIFSHYLDEVEDLILMVNCDHHIISNSTFSWWGAYLNSKKNKIVMSPSLWFGPKGPQDQQDIIPKGWIKI